MTHHDLKLEIDVPNFRLIKRAVFLIRFDDQEERDTYGQLIRIDFDYVVSFLRVTVKRTTETEFQSTLYASESFQP